MCMDIAKKEQQLRLLTWLCSMHLTAFTWRRPLSPDYPHFRRRPPRLGARWTSICRNTIPISGPEAKICRLSETGGGTLESMGMENTDNEAPATSYSCSKTVLAAER